MKRNSLTKRKQILRFKSTQSNINFKSNKNGEKQDLVPKNLENIDKKVNVKIKSSSNESHIYENLNSTRIKLFLTDSILLDGRDEKVAFVDFVYLPKRKNVECPDVHYTIRDSIG